MNDIPRIISALDYISEDKLARADKPRKRKPKALFYSLGGAAAAAAVAGVVLLQSGGQPVRSSSGTGSIVISPAAEGGSGLVIPDGETQLLIDIDNLPFNYVKDETLQKFDFSLPTDESHFGEYLKSYVPITYIPDEGEVKQENYPSGAPYDKVYSLPVFTGTASAPQEYVIGKEDLPDDCSLEGDAYRGAAKYNAYIYLADKYSDKLIFDKYYAMVGYSSLGEEKYSAVLHKYSDNFFEIIMNNNFTSIDFYLRDGEIVLRQQNQLDDLTAVGFYPTITPKEAVEKLFAGEGYAVVPEEYSDISISEDNYFNTELVYLENKDGYNVPYYRFVVSYVDRAAAFENNPNEYFHNFGAYYVPALAPECISSDNTSSPNIEKAVSVEEWLSQPHKQPLEGFTILDYTGKYRVIPANHEAKVMAIEDGEVIFADYDHKNLGGFTVVIKHSGGIYTLYHHLDKDLGFEVKVGDTVKAGQCIGYVGDSGAIEGYGLGFRCTDEEPNF